jgi:methionine-gamma-lyase
MRSLDSLAVHAGRDGLTGQGVHAVPIDLSTTAPLPSVADAGLAYEQMGCRPGAAQCNQVHGRPW